MNFEQKTFRIPKLKLPARRDRAMFTYLLIALLGLSFGCGGAFFMNNRANKAEANSGELQQTEEEKLNQSFKSDAGGVTTPQKITTDLAPKAIDFTQSNYSVAYGSTAKMVIRLLDGTGSETSALANTTVKLTGGGLNKNIVFAAGKSNYIYRYKGSIHGTHTVTASGSSLKSDSANVVVKKIELISITSPSSVNVTAAQLIAGVEITAHNRWSDNTSLDGTIDFKLDKVSCGGFNSSSVSTTNGRASATWTDLEASVGDKCIVTVISDSGIKASKTFTVVSA